MLQNKWIILFFSVLTWFITVRKWHAHFPPRVFGCRLFQRWNSSTRTFYFSVIPGPLLNTAAWKLQSASGCHAENFLQQHHLAGILSYTAYTGVRQGCTGPAGAASRGGQHFGDHRSNAWRYLGGVSSSIFLTFSSGPPDISWPATEFKQLGAKGAPRLHFQLTSAATERGIQQTNET